ncbi:hypothetical protein [Microbacterium aerolatum]|uniref:Uncharacterized protein n=1 Tax=Microbacterium aerolatum TaxID=153731 RepID=A0A511AF75_9MICO|nr:hypothetical protein [Microbacterium aerolatum]GEK86808.1 hypothetical protein MAE01_19840 [Microbacterium aerolatum]GGB24923.1 hypothetical protein GCM10007198_14110 [Microbacterium aerolatum]
MKVTSVEHTLSWLKQHLPAVTAQARDEYVLGDPTILRASLAYRGVAVPDRASLIDALGALFEWEDGGYDGFTVFASAVQLPASIVRLIRPAEGNPGRFVVLADCPYADEHVSRYRGHEKHGYGLPAYPVPSSARGVIGVRHAQCDDGSLSRVELIVPHTWEPYSWEDPTS